MKRLIRAALTKLGIRAPRCDKGRISQPRFLDQGIYLEMCVLEANHEGDHEQAHNHNVISRFEAFERIPQPDMLAEWLRDNPDPADAATELTRHDQAHGHCEEGK